MSFNPRPRTGGDEKLCRHCDLSMCFNPRPRTGGDLGAELPAHHVTVSIHAPARGATPGDFSLMPFSRFQSTPPHGGRHLGTNRQRASVSVSIHAPARGATKGKGYDHLIYEFQSTPPHGGRLGVAVLNRRREEFQSTPPHGGRRTDCKRHCCSECFNPRPRTGGDGDVVDGFNACNGVSIHAPARGATLSLNTATGAITGFNPRPRTGGDPSNCVTPLFLMFQSTPPHGGRR